MKKLQHIKITKNIKASDLVKEFQGSAFTAGKIGQASHILLEMIHDKECIIFLGQAGAAIPGGLKDMLLDLLEYVDVFVTTGATVTHDVVEALGYSHYQGDEKADDSVLYKKGIVRMYNSYMENKVYGKLEDFFNAHFDEFSKAETTKEFLWLIGSKLKKNSILKKCYDKKIPIFCPALSDSGIGLMVWNNLVKNKKCNVKMFEDLKEILDISWTAKKTGVIYLGGGVPKNFIQQAMQFSKKAIYGIQISTDSEEFGGSSGAPLKEGISWGKLDKNAKFVDVKCDFTVALPLLISYVKDTIQN